MSKKKPSGVSWVKPSEPSFLKKFKDDVGYKEGPTVDTKRQVMPLLEDDQPLLPFLSQRQVMPLLEDDSGSDREDELPQVVVLKSGDLSAEEVKKITSDLHSGGGAQKDDEASPDGKILFKKPAKRSSDKFQGITASSSKKKKSDRGEEEERTEEKSGKKVKNNSLLSFGGDEEEDED